MLIYIIVLFFMWSILCIVAEHFSTFGLLNQLITLSHQLNCDAFNRSNHKYMAHQLALLYVSKVNVFPQRELPIYTVLSYVK